MEVSMYICGRCGKLFKLKGNNKKVRCTYCDDTYLTDMHVSLDFWQSLSKEERARIVNKFKSRYEEEVGLPADTPAVKETEFRADSTAASEADIRTAAAEKTDAVTASAPDTADSAETAIRAEADINTDTDSLPDESDVAEAVVQAATGEDINTDENIDTNVDIDISAAPIPENAVPGEAVVQTAEETKEEAQPDVADSAAANKPGETGGYDFSFEEESENDLLEFGFGSNNGSGGFGSDGEMSFGGKKFDFDFEEDESGLFDFIPEDGGNTSTTETAAQETSETGTADEEPTFSVAEALADDEEPALSVAEAFVDDDLDALFEDTVPDPTEKNSMIMQDTDDEGSEFSDNNSDNDLFYFGDGESENGISIEDKIAAMAEAPAKAPDTPEDTSVSADDTPISADDTPVSVDDTPVSVDDTEDINSLFEQEAAVTTKETQSSPYDISADFSGSGELNSEEVYKRLMSEISAQTFKRSSRFESEIPPSSPEPVQAEDQVNQAEPETDEASAAEDISGEEISSAADETIVKDETITKDAAITKDETIANDEAIAKDETIAKDEKITAKNDAEDKYNTKPAKSSFFQDNKHTKNAETTIINETHYDFHSGSIFMKRMFSGIGIVSGLTIIALGAFALKLQDDALSISSMGILFAMCIGASILSYFGCKLGETLE